MDTLKTCLHLNLGDKKTMNDQKDTKKTGLDSYGHDTFSTNKSVINRSFNIYPNKKTEKLVTALYMVTDCMESEDALKPKLRRLGVDLLSHMYKLETLSPVEKNSHITSALFHIHEILSFIEMAYTIGYISDMNTAILKKEFNLLVEDLKEKQSKNKHFTFTLDRGMFSIPTEEYNLMKKGDNIKDINKRTNIDNVSFINKPLSYIKSERDPAYVLSNKKDRMDKIISLVKSSDKNGLGVSIKDISSFFTDCSEKTIQRELNALVANNKLKKTGSKRWSRYQLGSS